MPCLPKNRGYLSVFLVYRFKMTCPTNVCPMYFFFQLHTTEFNTNCALYELYTYAGKYNEQLIVTLEEDEFSQKQRLAYKLEQVHNIMAADNP